MGDSRHVPLIRGVARQDG